MNRLLVSNEPVEFEKHPVEVQDFNITTTRLIWKTWNIPQIHKKTKKTQRMSTCNPVGLGNTQILTDYVQNSPQVMHIPGVYDHLVYSREKPSYYRRQRKKREGGGRVNHGGSHHLDSKL
jgi:hypothetical protein